MHQIVVPVSSVRHQGRPIKHQFLSQGVFGDVENGISVELTGRHLKSMKFFSSLPDAEIPEDLELELPMDGCVGLLNILRTLEVHQLRPWQDDRYEEEYAMLVEGEYSWAAGPTHYDKDQVAVRIIVKKEGDLTERRVEVTRDQSWNSRVVNKSTFLFPWLTLTTIRGYLESLVEEWRGFSAHEEAILARFRRFAQN